MEVSCHFQSSTVFTLKRRIDVNEFVDLKTLVLISVQYKEAGLEK